MIYKTIGGTFIIILLAACQAHHTNHARHHAGPERLDAVQERGGHVMPFDLEKTVHVFTKTDEGGVQEVVAKNPEDQEQIGLIRDHLKTIQDQFTRRDFSGPAFIHGEDMPGLATLKGAAPEELQLQYSELPDGAEIHYTSTDPEIRTAIHKWFDAQLSDHARHAVPGLEK